MVSSVLTHGHFRLIFHRFLFSPSKLVLEILVTMIGKLGCVVVVHLGKEGRRIVTAVDWREAGGSKGRSIKDYGTSSTHCVSCLLKLIVVSDDIIIVVVPSIRRQTEEVKWCGLWLEHFERWVSEINTREATERSCYY